MSWLLYGYAWCYLFTMVYGQFISFNVTAFSDWCFFLHFDFIDGSYSAGHEDNLDLMKHIFIYTNS